MATRIVDLPFITKVVPPGRRRNALPRPTLLAILKTGLEKRVQVVWAPAGYGKTTSLTELSSQVDFPTCWYTLTAEDREPASFVRYCIKAVELQSVSLGPLRAMNGTLASTQYWRGLLGYLVTALSNSRIGRLLFVFDDLHEIDSYQETREALSLLIERAPDTVHFVLASRTRPSLPFLPRLVVEDEVSVIDMSILRFSVDETATLLASRWSRTIVREEAQLIHERTGGWPAGIDLLAKATRTPQLGTGTATNENTLFDYLTEEIMRRLPENRQRFLLQTSILREFTAELCDKLLDSLDSEKLLKELKDTGYFIEERPSSLAVYHYHDLFRNYLERRLKTEHPENCSRLHRKAASLFEQEDDNGAAILHRVAAGDTVEAALLLKRHAEHYLDRGKWLTVSAWLSSLPTTAVQGDPQLLLIQAKVQLRLGQPILALECLDRISLSSGDKETLGRAFVTKSFACRLLGKLDDAITNAKAGLALLIEAGVPHQEIAEGYRQLASAYGTMGDFKESQHNFELALSLAPESNLQLQSLIHDGIAVVHLERGELEVAAVHLGKARQRWLKLGNQGALAESLNNLGILYYWRGEFDLALDELREGMKAATAAGYQRMVATIRITQGIVQRANRNYGEALTSFHTGLEEARKILDSRLVAEATNGLASTYRKMGELGKSETLLTQAIIEAEQSGQKYFAARYHTALGKLYCQSQVLDKALSSLKTADELFQQQHSARGSAEVKLHEAVVYYRMGRIPDALSRMGELAEILEQLGYEGFLVADGDDALELLRLSVAKGIGHQRLKDLWRRLEGKSDSDNPPRTPVQVKALPVLKICGFGRAQVLFALHEIGDHEWRSRKAKELFFLLLCHKRPITKGELLEALYADAGSGDFEDALRMNIYRLRRAVYPECVLSVADGYCFNPEIPVEFDKEQFETLLQQRERTGRVTDDSIARLNQAVQLYQGHFLPEFYSEWCEDFRRSLEVKYHHALMVLAGYSASKGEFSRAVELLENVVASDPFDEAAYIQLAKGYIKLGDDLSALRRLRDYMRLAREELESEPSKEFLGLYSQVLVRAPFEGAARR